MPDSHYKLGVTALLTGILALGLAIIPRVVFDIPPPWPTDTPPAPSPPLAAKVVFVITAITALIGLGLGIVASWRERRFSFGAPAVALCSAALLWDYVLIGVALGIAFVFIVIVLSSFAS